ncbi:50S ribosomal protein L28 [candidate division KSB1 bacterium]|nr:50S ribosomal protein L28 [candidate division KSB1 bacterium]
MAKQCDICGKKPSVGHTVSHAHKSSNRRWLPNLKKVRAVVDGTPQRLVVCTRCIRSGKVTKPSPRPKMTVA